MKKSYIDLKFQDASNNLRMFYRDSQGDGPALILLHGGGITGSENWGKHYKYLSEKFRVISPDHRGHGATNNPRGTFGTYKDLGDDMAGFIEQMELDRPIIMGHSSGAVTSLHLSIFHPHHVSKQVLVGIHPNMGVSLAHKEGLMRVYGTKDYRLPPTKRELIWHDPRLAIWSWWMHRQVNWYELIRTAWPMWAAKFELTRCDERQGCDYARIKCPTLLVWGSDEDFGSYDDHKMLLDWIPAATGKCVKPEPGDAKPKVEHMFVVDQPEKLRKAISPFLFGDN